MEGGSLPLQSSSREGGGRPRRRSSREGARAEQCRSSREEGNLAVTELVQGGGPA
uniref:Uncharacterized protein n=1 Tax=Arundo donax TaxID=35708 RepID=A0A0A9BUU6_ARUDO